MATAWLGDCRLGTWGIGPFDNDTAADFAIELVTGWARMHDSNGDIDRVPRLLERVQLADDDDEAWSELGYRLCLEHDLVFPASFAALPALVRLASLSRHARDLAGAIIQRCAGKHGCDELLTGSAGVIADFRTVLENHLRTRPDDYLPNFISLLAAAGYYHWSAALGDFTDDFYRVSCPRCAVEVTIAIGQYGRYSTIRDWNLGDVDRRDLRPAASSDLSGAGLWMHKTAIRDGQKELALGLTYLFGEAECPSCAAVFRIATEYAAANMPVL